MIDTQVQYTHSSKWQKWKEIAKKTILEEFLDPSYISRPRQQEEESSVLSIF